MMNTWENRKSYLEFLPVLALLFIIQIPRLQDYNTRGVALNTTVVKVEKKKFGEG